MNMKIKNSNSFYKNNLFYFIYIFAFYICHNFKEKLELIIINKYIS